MSTWNEKRTKTWKYFSSVAGLAIFLFAMSGYALCIEPVNLMITAGTAGGGYYRACAAFAEYIKKDIPGSTVIVIPGGTWANLERLEAKKADIGIIANSGATLGWKGIKPAPRRYDLGCLPRCGVQA